MKKLVTMIGIAGLALAATAGINDALLAFSTVGPDKYSDGTTVLDGECYALVWTANGATFGGITADGKTVADTDKIVLVAPVAKDGRCPNVLFQVPSATADELKGGTYGVYLLDTRVTDASGNTAPRGAANGQLSLVNGCGLATGATKIGSAENGVATAAEKETNGNGQVIAAGVAAPANVPQPKITSIKIEGAYVRLTIQNAPGFLRVNSGADTAVKDSQTVAQDTANMEKDASGDVILYVPKAEGNSGFFKAVLSR